MKMEIVFSVVWPTVHRPVKIDNENASFYKCYLQSEDFWQRRFLVLLIESFVNDDGDSSENVTVYKTSLLVGVFSTGVKSQSNVGEFAWNWILGDRH